MTIFSQTSEPEFISQYWQQHPLLFRQCISGLRSLVNGDKLIGLACEHHVESRIISGSKIGGEWHSQQGPFHDKDFAHLRKNNWTLLIQNIDYWDAGIRDLLKHFDFLPSWRLNDIMASFAPVGGGVGPHFDYYDVFLIQASGSREWKLGNRCNENTALQSNQDLKLLAEFECQQSHILESADMLYIPAGIAHWGTAVSDECITLSVGFRAPSEKEIIQHALENLIFDLSDSEQFTEHRRYRDSTPSIDPESDKINRHALANLPIKKFDSEVLTNSIERAFGELVTRPSGLVQDELENKHMIRATPDEPCIGNLAAWNHELELVHYPGCRYAYSDSYLFVNGIAFECNENFAKMICDGLLKPPFTSQQLDLLRTLLVQNLLEMQETDA